MTSESRDQAEGERACGCDHYAWFDPACRCCTRSTAYRDPSAELARLRAENVALRAARDRALEVVRAGFDTAPPTRTFDLLGQIEDVLVLARLSTDTDEKG